MMLKIKQSVAGMFLVMVCSGPWAAPRPLPELGLADERGLAVPHAILVQSRPWVLVVVDASRTLTPVMLTVLDREEQSWNDAAVVVVIGSEGVLDKLRDLREKLPGVLFYRSTDARLAQRLKLPGVPAVLGIDAKAQVIWQEPGVPRRPSELRLTIENWTAPSPQENQVAPPN